MRRRDGDAGQLQLLESIMVAVFIFVAIAIAAVYRLPANPGTFQEAELSNLGVDALRVRQTGVPTSSADCNESPCPFATDLERLLSISMGYRGPTIAADEDPDASELLDYFEQALPPGARHLFVYSNGHNDTELAPANAQPPAAPVVVSRTLLSPNWTVHADQLNSSVWLRVGETTSFGALSTLHDPLNRTTTEFAAAWTALYATEVPANATYGTHKACFSAAECRYFTVVPDGVAPPGGAIIDAGLTGTAPLRTLGSWASLAKYRDLGSDGYTSNDTIYIDSDNGGSTGAGDLRLSPVAGCRTGFDCIAGTSVRATDTDSAAALAALPRTDLNLASADAIVDEGEALYIIPAGVVVAPDHFRVTRAGLYPMGSRVALGDEDVAAAAAQVVTGTASWVVHSDADSDGIVDENEPLFLNLTSHGQSGDLEPGDFHLNPIAFATQRYTYDVRLVIWYGV